ncbi:hypothetical protein JAO78_005340 [Alishewanella sp. 16-MA]|uniref:Adenine methyltransferase n=1 Tax=Alishewanella maricola TaxID=2795740 RepID=A0ABS8C1N2_9ALTE|nr:MT-A70 family methyltransferase [Alishewanella maricola]MCB5226236.1 hypothetical protein [Alishewanella maricola]
MTKKYNIIYADPPWSFYSVKTGGSMKSGAAAKYQTITLDQMKALDVPALCDKDCVLIMWYVSSQPQEALDLVKAWGFTLKNMNAFIWRKLSTNLIPHFGMGYWTRAGAECALIAVRGKPKAECRSIRQVRDEVVGEHSEKPAIFRDEIVKLCGDLPRLEMFARTAPAGWDVFGNEVDGTVHIDGNEPTATTCDAPAEPIATERKAIELITLEFTSEQLAEQLASGKLAFDGDHLALMLQLDGMFGKRDTYTTSQIRTAILALDEPGMITKGGEVVAAVSQVDDISVVELATEITEPATHISEPATEITEEQNDLFVHFDEAMAAEAEPKPKVITSKADQVKSDDAGVFFDQLQIPQNIRSIGAECEKTKMWRSGHAIWGKGNFNPGKIDGIGIKTSGDFKKGYFYEPILVVFHQGKNAGEYPSWPEALSALDALLKPQPETPQVEAHPFFSGFYNGNATYVQTVKDKIERVKTLSHEQCKVALTLSNLGSSATDAVNRRIKQLEREGMAA